MKYKSTKKKHEDNLKSAICQKCHEKQIYVELEYTHKNCRFDCVVVRGDDILAIIEVKNSWSKTQAIINKKNPTKQLKKYREFGVPVFVLWGWSGINALLARIKDMVLLYDTTSTICKPKITFYPEINIRREELNKLISQQNKDMKYNRAF